MNNMYNIILSKKYIIDGKKWMDVIIENQESGKTENYRSAYLTIYKYKNYFIKAYKINKSEVSVTRL